MVSATSFMVASVARATAFIGLSGSVVCAIERAL
jgi:hypothetical protein